MKLVRRELQSYSYLFDIIAQARDVQSLERDSGQQEST